MGINQNKPIGVKMNVFSGGPWDSLTVSCLFSFSEPHKPETKKELYDFLAITYYRHFFREEAKKESEERISKYDDNDIKLFQEFRSLYLSGCVLHSELIPSEYIRNEVRSYAIKTLPEVQLVAYYLTQLAELASLSCNELKQRIVEKGYQVTEFPFSFWQETFPSINFKKLFREGEFVEIYLGEDYQIRDGSGNPIVDEGRLLFKISEEELVSLFVEEQQKWMKEHSKRPSVFMGKKKQDYEDIRNYKGRYWGLDR